MSDNLLNLIRSGQIQQAEAQGQAMLAANPNDPKVMHGLALICQRQGHTAQALSWIEQALGLDAERVDFWLTCAGIKMQSKQWESARLDFERALQLNPNLGSAYHALAYIAMLQSDEARAEHNYKLALRTGDERTEVFVGYGNLLLGQGQAEKALHYLTRAAELSPSDPMIQASLGRAYLKQEWFAFAEQALRNALKLKPDYHAARVMLIQAMLAQNHMAEVQAEIEILQKSDTFAYAAYALWGDVARKNGQLERAVAHYQASLERNPKQALVVLSLARLCTQLRRYDDALRIYQSYLSDHPNDGAVQCAMAQVAAEKGDFATAKHFFLTALTQNPLELTARVGLAALSELTGDFDQAEHEVGQALAQDATHIGALFIKVRADLRHNRYVEAEKHLRSIQEAKLDRIQQRLLKRMLGLALDGQERFPEAVESWLQSHQQSQAELPPRLGALPDSLDAAIQSAQLNQSQKSEYQPLAFLLGAPGSGVEMIASLLSALPNVRVLGDRLGANTRRDGLTEFNAYGRDDDVAQVHHFIRQYVRPLQRYQLTANDVFIDWLPQFDARALPMLLRAFDQVKFIVVERGTEDLLLNWLALGCAAGWPVIDLEQTKTQLQDTQTHLNVLRCLGERVLIINSDQIYAKPQESIATLAQWLALPTSINPNVQYTDLVQGLGGLRPVMAEGRGLRYADALNVQNIAVA